MKIFNPEKLESVSILEEKINIRLGIEFFQEKLREAAIARNAEDVRMYYDLIQQYLTQYFELREAEKSGAPITTRRQLD